MIKTYVSLMGYGDDLKEEEVILNQHKIDVCIHEYVHIHMVYYFFTTESPWSRSHLDLTDSYFHKFV